MEVTFGGRSFDISHRALIVAPGGDAADRGEGSSLSAQVSPAHMLITGHARSESGASPDSAVVLVDRDRLSGRLDDGCFGLRSDDGAFVHGRWFDDGDSAGITLAIVDGIRLIGSNDAVGARRVVDLMAAVLAAHARQER